nr:hypothetical protein [uncultured Desulfobulbus sp.]
MITYLVIKLVTVAHDNEWAYLLTGWGQYSLLERWASRLSCRCASLPTVLSITYGHSTFSALISVLGVVWNRLNTAIICFNWKLYQDILHWKHQCGSLGSAGPDRSFCPQLLQQHQATLQERPKGAQIRLSLEIPCRNSAA